MKIHDKFAVGKQVDKKLYYKTRNKNRPQRNIWVPRDDLFEWLNKNCTSFHFWSDIIIDTLPKNPKDWYVCYFGMCLTFDNLADEMLFKLTWL